MPRYDFKCPKCGFTDEIVCRVRDLPKMQMSCQCGAAMHNDVAANAKTQNPMTRKEYFSEMLDATVTGPNQFESLCRERGVTPVPQGITKEIPDHMKSRTPFEKEQIAKKLRYPGVGVDSEAI